MLGVRFSTPALGSLHVASFLAPLVKLLADFADAINQNLKMTKIIITQSKRAKNTSTENETFRRHKLFLLKK
jgi:hypothetical protein